MPMDNGVSRILRVGLIGLGEIAQVSHISVLSNLSDYFTITYLCDVSQSALEHCAQKISGHRPYTTRDAAELCASPEVDVVFVCSSTPLHTTHVILGLKHNKYVFVEKPVALCYEDLDAIEHAEQSSNGKVFVGYMRRYAQGFMDAIQEIGSMREITYVRVRDIIGQNRHFVDQSATYPKRFTDYTPEDTENLLQLDKNMVSKALLEDYKIPVTTRSTQFVQALGGLGSHDLSAMRELIGMPKSVLGSSLTFPIWAVIFEYDGFPVVYESGMNEVPLFDAHIEVYSQNKIVRINYDTPYVRGLPVTMTVREKIDGRAGGHSDGYQERTVRKTFEDPYTLEFLDFYHCVQQKKVPKTNVSDARQDLDIFKMIFQSFQFH